MKPTAEQIARVLCEMANVLVVADGRPFENKYVCPDVTTCGGCMARAYEIIRMFDVEQTPGTGNGGNVRDSLLPLEGKR